MKKHRRWWLAAVTGAALATLAGIGAVMAQEPIPTGATSTTFLERVAGKLGIEAATLRDAVKSSATDEIDERVAAGDLTQEQADAAKDRIANAPDDALIGRGVGRGPGAHGGRYMVLRNGELAEFLGLSDEALLTALQEDGATLASVAEANGKSRDELKAFLTSEFQAHLDEVVAEGGISQEEADARLAEKTANLDALIDGAAPFRRFRMGPGGPFGEHPIAAIPDNRAEPGTD